MRKFVVLFLIISLLSLRSQGQTAADVISSVRAAQRSVTGVSYRVVRQDTLVTGDTRTLSGEVKMQADPTDPTFGFLFWAREDGANSQLVFNGPMSYATDDVQKTYVISTDQSAMKALLYRSGGRVVVPDLIRLDTSGAAGFRLSQDRQYFYLTVLYPDLTQYDVTNRFKTVTIDKLKFLPVAVRQHQETLGKVQDLSWKIRDLQINGAVRYDFAGPDFLKSFTMNIPPVAGNHPLTTLKGKGAPPFSLRSFGGELIKFHETTGKVVLLDFWEVWCAPCIESMPKIQRLYDKFKDDGLVVFGIINDLKQLESARRFIARRPDIQIPMLIGNADLKQNYQVKGVPMYVLVGRNGKIRFIGLGYSGELESEIENAVREK